MNILNLSPELRSFRHIFHDDHTPYHLHYLSASALPNLKALRGSPYLIHKLAPGRASVRSIRITEPSSRSLHRYPTTRLCEDFSKYPRAHAKRLTINCRLLTFLELTTLLRCLGRFRRLTHLLITFKTDRSSSTESKETVTVEVPQALFCGV